MNLPDNFTLETLLQFLQQAEVEVLKPFSDLATERLNDNVLGLNILPLAQAGDLVFADTLKHLALALQSPVSTILCSPQSLQNHNAAGKPLICVDDPYRTFALLIKHFGQLAGADARLAANVQIEDGAIIGKDVVVGENSTIGANCVVYPGTTIGANVVIQAGSIIGADGFYYQRRSGKLVKLPSGGHCTIEDDVEIGAQCTIDRGVTGVTRIGRGTKIDNQVHVGHDTVIGEHCLIAGCVGIAGTAILEERVTLWGQVGISCLVTVGAGAEILAQSAVLQDVPAGKRYFGTPAQDARTRMKEIVLLRKQTQSLNGHS